MINKISFRTKMGWLSVFEDNGKIFKINFGKLRKNNSSKILKKFKKEVLQFYQKKTDNISTSYILKGTKIQKKVWRELKKIKKGTVKSYGEIAKTFNISPRYVGKICGQNKLVLLIPCHRVIKSNGNLGGFSAKGGIKLKRKLLKFEKKAA